MTRQLICTLLTALAVSLPAIEIHFGREVATWHFAGALAGPADNDAAEKEAFESAKELGTVEAWDAFLASYKTGFRADLARAYLKKLAPAAASGSTPASPAPVAAEGAPPPAQEIDCKLAERLRSESSVTATKITFVNATESVRVLKWIDFDGKAKEYARLKPGDELTQDTFITHPWMATDGEGNCSQIFRPLPGRSLARLEIESKPAAKSTRRDDDDDDDAPRKKKRAEKSEDSKPAKSKECPKGLVRRSGVCVDLKKAEKSAASSCKELGLAYVGGKCVAKTSQDKQRFKTQKKKGCPPGTYLNPVGVCQPNETGG